MTIYTSALGKSCGKLNMFYLHCRKPINTKLGKVLSYHDRLHHWSHKTIWSRETTWDQITTSWPLSLVKRWLQWEGLERKLLSRHWLHTLLLFFHLIAVCGQTGRSFSELFLSIVTQDTYDQYLTNFIGNTKINSLKNVFLSSHLRRVWSKTCDVFQLIYGNQPSYHPKNNKKQFVRNSETRFKAKKTEKLSWEVKTSEEKEKISFSEEIIDWNAMWK